LGTSSNSQHTAPVRPSLGNFHSVTCVSRPTDRSMNIVLFSLPIVSP
jgi:hypothetical protein